MNKLIHGPGSSGQSIADRVLAAKHTVAGQSLQKVIGKATTEEVLGPKRKHLDYLLQCTNEPNVSIPQMANFLIERTQATSWVIVFKALVTTHNLMNYGNERFTQYLASNNCSFNLSNFTDRTGNQGYDMSAFVRRYSKYLNEKAIAYRLMAFDFCKVKRGKEDGLLRTMSAEKFLKTLPVLQKQLDALLEFYVTPNELNNGVINAAFMLLFKDLIRLFACYNDGIINLLEKFFEMNKKNCKDAVDVYKKFLARMDRVCEFLKVAESMGIDKGDIPDLAKAPSSLLDALEQHLSSIENSKKTGSITVPKPAAGVSAAISEYASASQVGAAPGAGSGVSITEEERQRILEEEQRQLDQMKQQRLKQLAASGGGGSPTSLASSNSNTSVRAQQQTGTATAAAALSSPSKSIGSSPGQQQLAGRNSDDLLALNSPTLAYSVNPSQSMFTGPGSTFPPASNPFGAAYMQSQPGTAVAWGGSTAYPPGAGMSNQPVSYAGNFATEANFVSAFGRSSNQQQQSGFDGHGEILQPMPASSTVSYSGGSSQHSKLVQQDLDGSLAALAGNLSIRPTEQVKKTDHSWVGSGSEKQLTGSVGGGAWGQPPSLGHPPPASGWGQNVTWSTGSAYPVSHGMQPMMIIGGGMPMAGQPTTMGAFPVAMVQPGMVGTQQHATGWAPMAMQQPMQQPIGSQQHQTSNDPFGAL